MLQAVLFSAFAPNDVEQVRILQKLRRRFERVSVERILSGAGLESLYQSSRGSQEARPQLCLLQN